MRRFLSLLAVVLSLCLCPLARAQQPALDLEKTFTAANALSENKRYADALTEYQKILAVEPNEENTLRNGAMAAYFAGDYKTALAYYRRVKAAHLSDGFIRAKLVQVYQAMGDDKARDAERAGLIALHNAGKDTSSLAKRTDFCREQYNVGAHDILVYEPFVFKPRTKNGYFAVRYVFVVAGADGKRESLIEVGWNTVEKNAKGVYRPSSSLSAFYFDAYYPDGPYTRATMGLFTKELSYAATKSHVQAILEGKVKPSGGTLREATDSAPPAGATAPPAATP